MNLCRGMFCDVPIWMYMKSPTSDTAQTDTALVDCTNEFLPLKANVVALVSPSATRLTVHFAKENVWHISPFIATNSLPKLRCVYRAKWCFYCELVCRLGDSLKYIKKFLLYVNNFLCFEVVLLCYVSPDDALFWIVRLCISEQLADTSLNNYIYLLIFRILRTQNHCLVSF